MRCDSVACNIIYLDIWLRFWLQGNKYLSKSSISSIYFVLRIETVLQQVCVHGSDVTEGISQHNIVHKLQIR